MSVKAMDLIRRNLVQLGIELALNSARNVCIEILIPFTMSQKSKFSSVEYRASLMHTYVETYACIVCKVPATG
jgi:hypothetical protein